jgi:hypothetical protein
VAAYAAALVLVLGTLAWLSPAPDHITDRGTYEATAAQKIVLDCDDLHCFRALVAWTLGVLPGPSLLRWKSYAVLCNAAAAVMVFQLCLTFGLSTRAAWTASIFSAFGFGSLYTLHDSYTSDPLMYLIGPLITNELLRARLAVAGLIGAIGVFAKEFAAAPLFLFTMYETVQRHWQPALRALLVANAAFLVWVSFHLTLIILFNYGYGGTTSTRFLSGGGIGPWFVQQTPRAAVTSVFNEFGVLWLLAPAGFFMAPRPLRWLSVLAAPIALVLCYVQQPDRALWNFHFLVTPLAAVALDRAPVVIAALTTAAFVVANLRVGAQLPFVPAARFALAASVVLAVVAVARRVRVQPDVVSTT